MGVITSYYGWDGKDHPGAERKLLAALDALRHAGISKDLVIELNDCGMTFDETADFLDSEVMSWQIAQAWKQGGQIKTIPVETAVTSDIFININ